MCVSKGDTGQILVSGALLQLRNTPDRDSKLSPGKALFERELRDFLPRLGSALMGDMWMNLVDAREGGRLLRHAGPTIQRRNGLIT